MTDTLLTLNDNDPLVESARKAEKALFDFYKIKPKEHFITLPGQNLKVRVLETGQGEPLVVVPGNTGDAFVLASLLAALKGRRIFAINRPGAGLSEGMDHNAVDIEKFAASCLNTVFETLDLYNVDVVAHSMGAHWSTLLAIKHPDKVKKLVLLGNPGNIMGGKPPLALRLLAVPLFTGLALHFMIPKTEDDGLKMLTAMGHSAGFVATLPRELAKAYFHFQHLPHYKISAGSLLQNMIPEIKKEDLSFLKKPAALILGTNDNFLSQKKGSEIVAAMPAGSFYSIADSGHLPWLEDPVEIAKIIINFLENKGMD